MPFFSQNWLFSALDHILHLKTSRLQNLIYPRRNLYINEANIIQLTLRSRLG